jgi:hypothetical protein
MAQMIEVFYTAFGPVCAEEIACPRRKEWFDPTLVDVFLAEAREGRIWESLDESDFAHSVSLMEPVDRVLVADSEWLDLTAQAFAWIIDAKSPFTYQHYEDVARAATKITEHMGSRLPSCTTRCEPVFCTTSVSWPSPTVSWISPAPHRCGVCQDKGVPQVDL